MKFFGHNRYAMLLTALFVAGAAGCSESSRSGGGFASTVAPATSGTAAGTTTAAVSSGNGPLLVSANYTDADQDNLVSKGDKIVLTFDKALDVVPVNADPNTEISLAVQGDTFGQGATLQQGGSATLEVVIGDNANLKISKAFDALKTTAGSPTGINVSPSATLKGVDGDPIQPALAPVDVDGQLAAGFIASGSLNFARGGHQSVVLNDGRVLVVGGLSAKGRSGYTAEPELFDPLTQTFSTVSSISGNDGLMRKGKITVKQTNFAAVKLSDGTVLVCGGYGIEKKSFFGLGKEKEDTLKSAFIFDPTTNTFKQVGDMQYARHGHTATLLSDGRVMIAGGYNDSWWSKHKTQTPVELYNPAKGKFEKVGGIFSRLKTKEGRMNHTATAIEGGNTVLLAGGNYYKGGYLFGLIKPKLNMTKGSEVVRDGKDVERAGDLNNARMGHSALAVTPRNVLIAGGYDPSGIQTSLESYDSATAAWSVVGTLPVARTGCEIAMDGTQALIMGGTTGTAESNRVDVYNADSKQMENFQYTMRTARNAFTVSKLQDGRILVIGGMSGAGSLDGLDGQPLASAEIFVNN